LSWKSYVIIWTTFPIQSTAERLNPGGDEKKLVTKPMLVAE
jgi:hypothetical protein